ncbi:zinc ribbon domain-containing protein [Streptomyces sp. NPDC001269]
MRCTWKTSRCRPRLHRARQVRAGRGTVRVRRMLEYEGVRHGRTFAKVDPAFPSSQVCSPCGLRDGPESLHVRKWMCGERGTVHDRDHIPFEGRRIVAAGRVETRNACGALVRRAHVPAQRGEAVSPRKGQTPQAGVSGLQAREHVNCADCPGTRLRGDTQHRCERRRMRIRAELARR